MGEVRIVVDLPADETAWIEEDARAKHRDRKHHLEWIINNYVRNNRNSKEKP